MAKGDDAIAKKRNKVIRKRLRRESGGPSASSSAPTEQHIKRIIADKRRRKNLNRRGCRGMCYSLPTPENPFNDHKERISEKKQSSKQKVPSEAEAKNRLHAKKRDAAPQEEEIDNLIQKRKKIRTTLVDEMEASQLQTAVSQFAKVFQAAKDGSEPEQKKDKRKRRTSSLGQGRIAEGLNDLQGNAILEMVLKLSLDAVRKIEFEGNIIQAGVDKLTLNNNWGIEFWKACLKGSNILGISKASFDLEQTAWVVSTAASLVINKQMRDSVISRPIVLYIVASQEHALKVRMLLKPLRKLLGIHSVSLHPGASVHYQVEGLKICSPEILVSTPERLSELIALKALDISSISFLVIDGLKNILEGDFIENLKSVRYHISGNPQTVILSNTYAGMSTAIAQYLLEDPIQRVTTDSSIAFQSACIAQAVSVFTSEEKKFQKAVKILRQINDKKSTLLGKIVVVVNNAVKAQQLVAAMESEGYSVRSVISDLQVQEKIPSNVSENYRLQILVSTESLLQEDVLSEAQVLIIYDFPSSLQLYSKILTGMARFSVLGILYSFCTGADALLAAQLIKLLDECSQPVPQALRMLAEAVSTIQC